MTRGLILTLILLLSGGCASHRPQTASYPTTGEFVELNILTAPVGFDMDGRPGVDSISLKVYANIANNPKPVPIRSGSLEVVMFDGTLYGRANLPPPLRVWTFTAEQLRATEFKARIGTGYELVLPWGNSTPRQRIVSVGARYTSPDGKVLTSSLSSVTVMDRQSEETP